MKAQPESPSTSLAEERRHRILRMIDRNGGVTIAELVESLEVTPMTVWRDLKQLEEERMLRRVRGGAVRIGFGGAGIPADNSVQVESRPFKAAVAAEAVKRFVGERNSLFISGGSTTVECVPFLPKSVRIITNSMLILNRSLASPTASDVQCAGGILNHETGSFYGPDCRRFIQSKHVDVFLLSCDGLHLSRGITDIDTLEVEVKQEMAKHASKVVLLADSSKLDKISSEQVLPLRSIHGLVTDNRAPKAILKAFGKHFPVVAVDL